VEGERQERSMTLSARNHLPGVIEEIVVGDVLVHVTVRVGQSHHRVGHHETKRRRDGAEEGRFGHSRRESDRGDAVERLVENSNSSRFKSI
jgi:hypothetical protein